MRLNATKGTMEDLKRLPTSVRPVINPDDVWVPDGYEVDVVIAGLSFPTGMAVADDGTLFINEGGSTWPTRPSSIRLDPRGNMDVFAVETLGGPRGLAYHDGYLYVTVKGGYHTKVNRYHVRTRKKE